MQWATLNQEVSKEIQQKSYNRWWLANRKTRQRTNKDNSWDMSNKSQLAFRAICRHYWRMKSPPKFKILPSPRKKWRNNLQTHTLNLHSLLFLNSLLFSICLAIYTCFWACTNTDTQHGLHYPYLQCWAHSMFVMFHSSLSRKIEASCKRRLSSSNSWIFFLSHHLSLPTSCWWT